MSVHLEENNRLRRREISENLDNIRRNIYQEVEERFRIETKQLRAERDKLFEEEREFQNELKDIFSDKKMMYVGRLVIVEVQVGPNGGEIIRKHIGTVTKIYNHNSVCFNMSDSDYNDGKEFTIGGSCVMSFEILPND